METSTMERERTMMIPEPQMEHKWLQRLVGEWIVESEADMGEGKPAEEFRADTSIRSLGGLWIVAETQGDMPGIGPATTIMTLGYDPRKQRFVGSFVASMMTQLWLYEGVLDAVNNTLPLDTKGPSMTDEAKMSRYRDVVEIKSDDHWALTSHVQRDDGTWQRFMTSNYRRKR